jgi:EthD domain
VIKLFAFLIKRPDISDDYFHLHWKYPHGEIGKGTTTVVGYVQSHRMRVDHPMMRPAVFDGVAEVWFANEADAFGLGDNPSYRRGAFLDEPNFLDVEKIDFSVTQEIVLIDGPTGGAKVLQFVNRLPGIEADEFLDRLMETTELAGRLGVTRHVICTEILGPGGEEGAFGVIREFWWPSVEAFTAAHLQRPDEWAELVAGPSIDRLRSRAMVASEYELIAPAVEART